MSWGVDYSAWERLGLGWLDGGTHPQVFWQKSVQATENKGDGLEKEAQGRVRACNRLTGRELGLGSTADP